MELGDGTHVKRVQSPGFNPRTHKVSCIRHLPVHFPMNRKAVLTSRIRTVTVADPALGVPNRSAGHMLHEFAEHLRPLLATGRIGTDVGTGGQVENVREQAWKSKFKSQISQVKLCNPRHSQTQKRICKSTC